MNLWWRILLHASVLLFPTASFAGEVQVAVAANFAAPMQAIAPLFEQETGHKVRVVLGGTGKFYAQITQAAPFDILLAADDETPTRLAREQLAVPNSQFTYAIGRLVLWSAKNGQGNLHEGFLQTGRFQHLALANPKTAPYGAAARQVIHNLGLSETLKGKTVLGENIAQTYQFVATGNAELGLLAYAQVVKDGQITHGTGWLVPASLHDPIRQDAILLLRGQDNPAAQALMRFLRRENIRQMIRAFGYETP